MKSLWVRPGLYKRQIAHTAVDGHLVDVVFLALVLELSGSAGQIGASRLES